MTETSRPAEFDARVMAYLPGLSKLARRLTNSATEREDLVQETMAFAFDRWQNFREDGGLWNWLQMNMRAILQMQRSKQATLARRLPIKDDPEGRLIGQLGTAARQEDIAYANQVVRRLSYTRDGRMLVRLGKGEKLREIGERRGIGSERVRQLTERARERLVRTTKVVA